MKQLTGLQKAVAGFLALCTLFSLYLEFFFHEESHGATAVHHFWEGIPMFWILFGAVGCGLIIIFAKKILGPIIYKKEDYYNE